MVPSKRPGPAGRTADPGLSGCGTRDRARRFTAVLLAEVQMLQDLEAVSDEQREEISGRAHRFDSRSRRVHLNQRIKSLSGRGSGGFAVVHVAGQVVYAAAARTYSAATGVSRRCPENRRFYSRAHRGWSRSREIVGTCGWAVGWGYPVCGAARRVRAGYPVGGAARRSVRVGPSVVPRSGSVRACGGVGWWRAARDAGRFAGV